MAGDTIGEIDQAPSHLMRAVFDSLLTALLVSDDTGRFIDSNPAASVLFGLTSTELRECSFATFTQLDRDGLTVFTLRDGTRRTVEMGAKPNVLPGKHLWVLRDVSARVAAEEALSRATTELRSSRDALDEAQAIAQLGSWWAGIDSDQIGWSNECYRIFGLPVGGPMTKDVLLACIHPADVARVKRALPEMLAGGDSIELEYRVLWPDRRVRWIRAKMVADRRGVGPPTTVRGTIQDVTERHEAVVALLESELRYRRIVENTSDGIWLYDANDITTFVNSKMAEMLGCTVTEAIGRSVFAFIDPSMRALAAERTASRRHGVSDRSDFTLRRLDGTDVQTSIQANPLFDREGQFEGVVALIRDVTAERDADAKRQKAESELHQAENQLRQGQKMEAVGRLAGGVAHDFNNLLSVILSYAELALGDLPPEDRLREDMAQIVQAGKQAAGLTRQLLAFSRQQVLQPRVIELQKIVLPLELMLRRMLGEDVVLTIVATHTNGQVLVDPGQIEQVVMNLTVNARDAMPDGGELTIGIADVQLEAARVTARVVIPPGDYVVMSVTDTGSGMDDVTATRIFEPFFTTKMLGKGTGLGLSTVFGIVEQSSGYVDVASELGKGTRFSIYIPRTNQVPIITFVEAAATTARGHETILLVEDEAQVRTVACSILRRSGYTVLESSNAGEAFLIAKSYAPAIDLLLTDVVMPRMSGRKLAEELALTRPAMKVVYLSGYTDAIIQHGVLDAGTFFLQKPFTPDLLLRKVHEALGTTGSLARHDMDQLRE